MSIESAANQRARKKKREKKGRGGYVEREEERRGKKRKHLSWPLPFYTSLNSATTHWFLLGLFVLSSSSPVLLGTAPLRRLTIDASLLLYPLWSLSPSLSLAHLTVATTTIITIAAVAVASFTYHPHSFASVPP